MDTLPSAHLRHGHIMCQADVLGEAVQTTRLLRRLGGDHCAPPRCEREPGVLVATTISARRTGAGERPDLRRVGLGADRGGTDRYIARAASEGRRWGRRTQVGSTSSSVADDV